MSDCKHLGTAGNGPGNPPLPWCRKFYEYLCPGHARTSCYSPEMCEYHPDWVYQPPVEEHRCPTCGGRMTL